MNDPGMCEWLHNALQPLPLITFPFVVDSLPVNGIYFFYERGESCGHDTSMNRIVRVGTHKDGNFRSRIAEHYLLNEGRATFTSNQASPHDRSIFRKHIGRAILNRDRNPYLAVWDITFTSRQARNQHSHLRDVQTEMRIETEVTKTIRQNFSFRFVELEGQDNRMGTDGLERALIGSLARCLVCRASADWLGHSCSKAQVRNSGLWLVQHLGAEPMSNVQRAVMQAAVDHTKKKFGGKALAAAT
jgi:hypothetical protein